MNIALILLQANNVTSTTGQILTQVLFFAGIFLVFYFFMIRPQQQKQKKQEQFRKALKKGDSVVTIGGLHGKIYAIQEDTITIEVDKGVKLTFEKSAISMEVSQKTAKITENALEKS